MNVSDLKQRVAGSLRLSSRSRLDATFQGLLLEGVVHRGRNSYGLPNVHVWRNSAARPVGGRVIIGNFVSIADDVHLFTGGDHLLERVTVSPIRQLMLGMSDGDDEHPGSKGDVVIGHDVWLAHGATVLSGVTIGVGAVIGANAVVAQDVRPYAIMVGNPAREIRRRFADDVVDALLELAWWEQTDEWIIANAHDLCSRVDESIVGRLRSTVVR